MAQRDLAAHLVRRERPRALGVDDVVRQVEVLEDALEERERRLHLDRGLQHLADREQQPGLQRGERDDRARAQVRVPGDQVDQRGRDREEGLHEREERAADHRLAHLQPGEAAVLVAVALDRVAAAVEHLRQQHARHRERLLRQRRELGERLLRLAREPPPRAADAIGEVDEDRHDPEREQGQLPGEQQHRDHRAQHRDRVREHRRGGVGDHVLDAADVVLQARLQLAGARGGEEPERHRLQVVVEPVAQVLHHALPDHRRQVRLEHADRRRRRSGRRS